MWQVCDCYPPTPDSSLWNQPQPLWYLEKEKAYSPYMLGPGPWTLNGRAALVSHCLGLSTSQHMLPPILPSPPSAMSRPLWIRQGITSFCFTETIFTDLIASFHTGLQNTGLRVQAQSDIKESTKLPLSCLSGSLSCAISRISLSGALPDLSQGPISWLTNLGQEGVWLGSRAISPHLVARASKARWYLYLVTTPPSECETALLPPHTQRTTF